MIISFMRKLNQTEAYAFFQSNYILTLLKQLETNSSKVSWVGLDVPFHHWDLGQVLILIKPLCPPLIKKK